MDFDPYQDRRAQYRNDERRQVALAAELIVGPGKSFDAEVVNTSANGVRLAFPRGAAPRLAMGTLVEVRFQEAGVGRPLVALGQVGNQVADGDPPALGVRFTRREEFYRQLTPALWEQFNRRRRMRVRFLAEKQPRVRIETAGRAWEARLFDLSEQGLGLDLEPTVAEELADYELVRVRGKLPGKLGALDLAGLRVHETAFGRAQRLGLLFDPPHTPDFGGQQERIERLVRQVQLSRR